MRIRPATPAEAAPIARLHIAAWRAAYAHLLPAEVLRNLSVADREARWRSILAESPLGTLVAESGGEVTGFVSFGPARGFDAIDRAGEIYALYVDPSYWSRGVGRQLLDAAVRALSVDEYLTCILWVLEGNVRARAFYESAGMRWEPEVRAMIDLYGVSLPELRYTLTLDSSDADPP